MFERVAAWVQTPGNITLRRTGWGPAMLKEIRKVAAELPPVGGQRVSPFCPLTGNMFPVVMLQQIAPAKEAWSECESYLVVPVSSIGVKWKRQRAPLSPVPEPHIESSKSDPDTCVSSTGAKGKRKRMAASAGRKKKKKKSAPCPYSSWTGTGTGGGGGRGGTEGRLEVSLPLRIVTSVRTVLDYVRGTGHRPKTCMEPFPLQHGAPAGQGELVLLIVPPKIEASGSHKVEQ